MKKWMTLMLGLALLLGSGFLIWHRLSARRESMFNRAPGQSKGPRGEFAAFLENPIPSVDPKDMQSIWALYQELGLEKEPKGGGITGIDVSVYAKRCSPGANVMAVSTRVALAKGLLQQGLLDKWKEGDSLNPKVFDVLAKCPLTPEAGGMRFDPEAILRSLEEAPR